MPDTPRTSPINLLEVTTRAEHAHHIITGFSLAMPTLADQWHQVDEALSDIPLLAQETSRLRDWLIACRIDRANLAAAGRATITAHRSGDPDPFSYLDDELLAQGFGASRGDA